MKTFQLSVSDDFKFSTSRQYDFAISYAYPVLGSSDIASDPDRTVQIYQWSYCRPVDLSYIGRWYCRNVKWSTIRRVRYMNCLLIDHWTVGLVELAKSGQVN
jgi:hypothetical protein